MTGIPFDDIYYIDFITRHREVDDKIVSIEILWSTGEKTWEPLSSLLEAVSDFESSVLLKFDLDSDGFTGYYHWCGTQRKLVLPAIQPSVVLATDDEVSDDSDDDASDEYDSDPSEVSGPPSTCPGTSISGMSEAVSSDSSESDLMDFIDDETSAEESEFVNTYSDWARDDSGSSTPDESGSSEEVAEVDASVYFDSEFDLNDPLSEDIDLNEEASEEDFDLNEGVSDMELE